MKLFILSFNFYGVDPEDREYLTIRKGIIAEDQNQAEDLAKKYLSEFDPYNENIINFIREVSVEEYIRQTSVNVFIVDTPQTYSLQETN